MASENLGMTSIDRKSPDNSFYFEVINKFAQRPIESGYSPESWVIRLCIATTDTVEYELKNGLYADLVMIYKKQEDFKVYCPFDNPWHVDSQIMNVLICIMLSFHTVIYFVV